MLSTFIRRRFPLLLCVLLVLEATTWVLVHDALRARPAGGQRLQGLEGYQGTAPPIGTVVVLPELPVIGAEVPGPGSWDEGPRARMISFWTTWCTECRGHLRALQDADLGSMGARVLSVSVGESEVEVGRFLAQHGLSLPTALDTWGMAAGSLAVQVLPTTLLLDASGRLVASLTGPLSAPDLLALASAQFLFGREDGSAADGTEAGDPDAGDQDT